MKNLIYSQILFIGLSLIPLLSFSQSIVKRSKVCGMASTVEMTISGHGTNSVTITTALVTQITGDVSLLSVLDGTKDGSEICVPEDGHTYWFVYFDPNLVPVQVPSGCGGYGCKCHGTSGSCTHIFTSSGDDGCDSNTCDGCCDLERLAVANTGGGVLLKADTITLNGTTYQ